MPKLGVVANGRSWRNARAKRAPAAPPGVAFEAPETIAGYGPAMVRMREAGVDVLAVAGGDGTLRDVLSALGPAYGDTLPEIALAPLGKTNAAAGDVGSVGHGPDALARLSAALASGAPFKRAVRRPLEVTADGRTLQGFVFGFGAFERATRLVNERVHSRGLAQRLGVAVGIAAAVRAALSGAERAEWRAGVPAAIGPDGAEADERAAFFFLATTLDKLMLGLWPFWGEGDGAIDHLVADAPPPRLASALLPIGRGRPRPWMRESYRSGRSDALSIGLRAPFIMDGDTFRPGADGRVELRAAPPVTFLSY
ncbi:diacylglycerol kinase family protein [Methylopila turkensis]|uniref:Diacylglycerol kinase n=1 Tax=Methylopila turkensis TaxID=1437816 RepID=A0A9W6JQS4_9HYPH|nr:diacylglycerol kinase family protein [Methylopila turkensis]GLK80315.1 diacylglycerol kinase [Methylopila turkensis]